MAPRRKSLPAGVEVLDDSENTRRNRLSKPLTHKSTSNLHTLAQQNARTKNNSTASLALSSYCTSDEARERIRSQIFSRDDVSPTRSFTSETSVRSPVASLVSKFEANASQQSLPSSPTKSRRPLSAIANMSSLTIRRKPVGDPARKRDLSTLLLDERPPSTGSGSSSGTIIEPTPIPPQRRASFQPGAATRRPSGNQQPSKESLKEESLDEVHEESDVSFTEGDDCDLWVPPPPRMPRTDTPTSMEYTHLGGLKLGTLHIVNGRASPAFSELSKNLLAKATNPVSQDLSSEYGDSEVEAQSNWEDVSVQLSSPDLSQHQTASLAAVVTGRISITEDEDRNLTTPTRAHPRPGTPDKTSRMAMEYMAELEVSPYSEPRSTSPAGSIVVTTRNMAEDEAFAEDDLDDEVVAPTPELHGDTRASWYSFEVEPSSGDRFDSALEIRDSPSPNRSQSSLAKRAEKTDSGYSSNASLGSLPGEAIIAREFVTHEELLWHKSPTAYSSVQVPDHQTQGIVAVRTATAVPSEHQGSKLTAFRTAPPALSLAAARMNAPSPNESYISAPTPTTISHETRALTSRSDPAVNLESPTKEIKTRKKLQKRKSSQGHALPRLAVLRQPVVHKVASIDFATIPPVSTQAAERLRTRSQGLPELERTYKSSQHVKNEASVSTLNIAFKEVTFPSPFPSPVVPSFKKSLLPWQRNQPRRKSFLGGNKEDKSTQKSYNNISQAQAMEIISDFDANATDIVASPYAIAEDALSLKTKLTQDFRQPRGIIVEDKGFVEQRARSEVRNVAVTDEQKFRSRSQPRISRPETAMIEEPCPRMQSYDEPRHIQTQQSHFNAKPNHERHRSMMDDRRAAEFARQKQKLASERQRADQNPRFNDRGGIPGRNIRPWSLVSDDIPPVPALPGTKQVLHRMSWQSDHSYIPPSQRASRQQTPVQSADSPPSLPWQGVMQQQYLMEPDYSAPSPSPSQHTSPQQYPSEPESPPPPPPAHSPRPSIIDFVDEPEEFALSPPAPPPPSHSPQPMDVQPVVEDPWAAQAKAWRARRQSAGEALRNSSDEPRPMLAQDSRTSPNKRLSYYEQAIVDEEPVYPVVPSRQSVRDDVYPVIPPRQSFQDNSRHHHTRAQTMQYPYQSHYQSPIPSRPLPTPTPNSRSPTRTQSRNSAVTYAASLADEIHPDIQRRPQPPPDFGRYSGGLMYGYERGSGFGGSAGTRSVSGKADFEFKSVALRGEYGIDMGDVPFIGVVQRL